MSIQIQRTYKDLEIKRIADQLKVLMKDKDNPTLHDLTKLIETIHGSFNFSDSPDWVNIPEMSMKVLKYLTIKSLPVKTDEKCRQIFSKLQQINAAYYVNTGDVSSQLFSRSFLINQPYFKSLFGSGMQGDITKANQERLFDQIELNPDVFGVEDKDLQFVLSLMRGDIVDVNTNIERMGPEKAIDLFKHLRLDSFLELIEDYYISKYDLNNLSSQNLIDLWNKYPNQGRIICVNFINRNITIEITGSETDKSIIDELNAVKHYLNYLDERIYFKYPGDEDLLGVHIERVSETKILQSLIDFLEKYNVTVSFVHIDMQDHLREHLDVLMNLFSVQKNTLRCLSLKFAEVIDDLALEKILSLTPKLEHLVIERASIVKLTSTIKSFAVSECPSLLTINACEAEEMEVKRCGLLEKLTAAKAKKLTIEDCPMLREKNIKIPSKCELDVDDV